MRNLDQGKWDAIYKKNAVAASQNETTEQTADHQDQLITTYGCSEKNWYGIRWQGNESNSCSILVLLKDGVEVPPAFAPPQSTPQ